MEMEKKKKKKNKVHKGILLNNLEGRIFCFKIFERRAKYKIAPNEVDKCIFPL
jgi:hypothetical protein